MALEQMDKSSSNHVSVRAGTFVSKTYIIPETFAELRAVGHTSQSAFERSLPAAQEAAVLHPNTSAKLTRITTMPRNVWGLMYLSTGMSEHKGLAMDQMVHGMGHLTILVPTSSTSQTQPAGNQPM